MQLSGGSAVVTGGASGLGLATVRALVAREVPTVIVDLPSSAGTEVAQELGAFFAPADVTDPVAVDAALDLAEAQAPIRALVHCAGRGGTIRVVNKDGSPGDLDLYEQIVRINLVGSYNVLRLTAARMARNEPVEDERGACVLTASVAAWEGQVGQLGYASAKAGIVGLTVVAARDLSRSLIRVNTIAPGIFDTPILDRLGDDTKAKLGAQVPNPARLGRPPEFALMALQLLDNPYVNAETVRLDGGVRMQPR
jgi:NAD(P)-dependent dehydrogenase (short-subunit alcohol dehydrogenase family)